MPVITLGRHPHVREPVTTIAIRGLTIQVVRSRHLTFVIVLHACALQDAQDRAECDRALAVVCGCSSVDCTADAAIPIVATLRRCDPDEIYRSRGYHLAVCIEDSPTYCTILDSLQHSDSAVCDETCHQDTACDLEQSCHDYQFNSCEVP